MGNLVIRNHQRVNQLFSKYPQARAQNQSALNWSGDCLRVLLREFSQAALDKIHTV